MLDVQTVNWSFIYFPTDWNSYRVIYSVKARLVDNRKGQLIAESSCARIPEKATTRRAGTGCWPLLKSKLQSAADECLGEVKSKLAI